jgi:hypothetical protein
LNPHSDLDLSCRTRVLFVTHHTSMVLSYVKEKLQSFHAYWSLERTQPPLSICIKRDWQTDWQSDRRTVRFKYATLRGHKNNFINSWFENNHWLFGKICLILWFSDFRKEWLENMWPFPRELLVPHINKRDWHCHTLDIKKCCACQIGSNLSLVPGGRIWTL